MRLGAQVSAAGGVYNAFERGAEIGADTVMVYTKSNRQWAAKALTPLEIERCQAQAQAYAGRVDPLVVHAAYLINVASPDADLWQKSLNALRDELERAAALGVELLVFHPGSHMGEGEAAGLARIARALSQALADTAGSRTRICLETMAGQGSNLGHKFEHLQVLLDSVARPERMGVCFDTCHVFAAGYDIRTPEAYAATMAQFDAIVGLDQIYCFHFNDSKHELGSLRDRHEHIGKGHIGAQGFANFVNDPRWATHPAHLETPKSETEDDGREIEMDPVNLASLRGLITA